MSNTIYKNRSWYESKSKTAILASTAEIICKLGARGATLKNIANRAGITEPAIFRHFRGIDALFAGLYEVYEAYQNSISASVRTKEKGLEKLQAMAVAFINFLERNKDLSYLVLCAKEVFGSFQQLSNRTSALISKEQEQARLAIADAVKSGQLKSTNNVDVLLATFYGGLGFVAKQWLDSGFKLNVRKEAFAFILDWEALASSRPSSADQRKKKLADLLNAPNEGQAVLDFTERDYEVRRGRPAKAGGTSGTKVGTKVGTKIGTKARTTKVAKKPAKKVASRATAKKVVKAKAKTR